MDFSLPQVCFEQTADWENRKEGERNEAVNQCCSLSKSWAQKASEQMRETPHPQEGLLLSHVPQQLPVDTPLFLSSLWL